ncbi:K02A2.6-like [Cordylochernes scorpioides]|uniref:K02A2.6-like n=1 Tax=Cordylochernes scorpioides TaxID=51811 RepID=A0ABY6L5H8_9ARAC|nr:K02A2.6-like [Cordylochernes scorpioides]
MQGHRKRRQFKQTDAFTRGMVIELKRAGWSIRQIAADTHLGASTVHRLWRRWLEQGNVAIYRNVGATRVTSARVDRRILRQAVAAPQATCTAILQHVQDTLDHSISTRTISRRLVANGLHSCRLLRRLPLTPPNRRQRLEWCRARSTWMTEWHRVVFSDESRFCLSSDSRRVRVWRRRGERSNPAAIVERPTVRQRGIMGTMTAQRYVDDVLRPVTLSYLQGVPNALYQQDNARPHTARISQQALQDVQMLPWPPYSPDLSPIEHVWDIIGRRLHALPQPRSEDELWQMVEREWSAIPQDAIRTLIDSLPRRVAACIAVRANSMSGCPIIVPFCYFRPGEDSFEIFVQRFEAAFEANALEEGKRMPIFVSLLDSEMLKLGNDLFFPSTMKEQPYERLIQRIKLHLAPRKKVIPQRCRFLKRIQLENESVSEYLRELRHLAMDCTFGEMLEVMLRERFVAGIKSESLQKKLLQEDDDVTLDGVFSMAVSFELAEQNAKELQDGLVAKMDIVPGGNRKNEARRGWQHGPGMQRRETICFRCGEKNSHLAPACPHKTKSCFKCVMIPYANFILNVAYLATFA